MRLRNLVVHVDFYAILFLIFGTVFFADSVCTSKLSLGAMFIISTAFTFSIYFSVQIKENREAIVKFN